MNSRQALKKDDGYILILALIMLIMVTILGVSATSTTNFEIRIAGNDRLNKVAFYNADGVNQVSIELLEQNIESRGFANGTQGLLQVVDPGSLQFYMNTEDIVTPANNRPTTGNYDILVPGGGTMNSYIKVYGNTQLSTGSALQIAAGYEGKGKGLSGGGGMIVYDVRSLARGAANSEARVWARWRHLL